MDPRYRNSYKEEDIRDELIKEIMQITDDQPDNPQTKEELDALIIHLNVVFFCTFS